MFSWLGGADPATDTVDEVQSENRVEATTTNKPTADDTFAEPECDYDRNPTQLYKLIENKRWDAAVVRAQSCPEEARTWVCRREKGGGGGYGYGGQQHGQQQIRWRLLPIHATCVFRSPLSLIEALIEAYPDGAQMKDVSTSFTSCLRALYRSYRQMCVCADDVYVACLRDMCSTY